MKYLANIIIEAVDEETALARITKVLTGDMELESDELVEWDDEIPEVDPEDEEPED